MVLSFVYARVNSLKKDINDMMIILKEITKLDTNSSNLKQTVEHIQKLKEEYYFNDALESMQQTIDYIRLGATRTVEIIKGLRNFSRMERD